MWLYSLNFNSTDLRFWAKLLSFKVVCSIFQVTSLRWCGKTARNLAWEWPKTKVESLLLLQTIIRLATIEGNMYKMLQGLVDKCDFRHTIIILIYTT